MQHISYASYACILTLFQEGNHFINYILKLSVRPAGKQDKPVNLISQCILVLNMAKVSIGEVNACSSSPWKKASIPYSIFSLVPTQLESVLGFFIRW